MKRIGWIFDVGFRRFDSESSRSPGWALHMVFFCSLAVWCIACFTLGLGVRWIGIIFPLVFLADAVGTYWLLRHSTNRLKRLGLTAVFRPRFWIEVSAITLTLGFSCGVFAVTGGIPGLVNWQNQIQAAVIFLCPFLITTSYVLTTFAFALGLLTNRTPRGRSLELVAFFLWCYIGNRLLDVVLPRIDAVNVAIAMVGVGVLVLIVAALLFVFKSTASRLPDHDARSESKNG